MSSGKRKPCLAKRYIFWESEKCIDILFLLRFCAPCSTISKHPRANHKSCPYIGFKIFKGFDDLNSCMVQICFQKGLNCFEYCFDMVFERLFLKVFAVFSCLCFHFLAPSCFDKDFNKSS